MNQSSGDLPRNGVIAMASMNAVGSTETEENCRHGAGKETGHGGNLYVKEVERYSVVLASVHVPVHDPWSRGIRIWLFSRCPRE